MDDIDARLKRLYDQLETAENSRELELVQQKIDALLATQS